MNKKILVVYYSHSGNTERVAKDIAARLNADIEKITDKKDRSGFFGAMRAGKDATFGKLTTIGAMQKDPADYDLTIMGTPTWSWSMTPAIRTYISMCKDKFKQVAFFTTAGGTKPDKIVAKMERLAGKKAVAFTGFNQGELKNEKVYNEKLNAFVEAVSGEEKR